MRNSDSRTGDDYIISPVCNDKGEFFDSRNCKGNMPKDADANGAYNIARKGMWIMEQIKECDDLSVKNAINCFMTNKDWFSYATQE